MCKDGLDGKAKGALKGASSHVLAMHRQKKQIKSLMAMQILHLQHA